MKIKALSQILRKCVESQLDTANNVLITFGNVGVTDGMSNAELGRGTGYGRVVEVTRDTPAERVFDVSVFRTGDERRVIYRSEKIPSLYPDGVIVTQPPVTTTE